MCGIEAKKSEAFFIAYVTSDKGQCIALFYQKLPTPSCATFKGKKK